MKYLSLKDRRIVIIGFGSIGTAILPLILRHIDINPDQIEVIAADDVNKYLAKQENVKFECFKLTQQNYESFLSVRLKPRDILLNLSVNISCLYLIRLSQKQGALYLDTSTETWSTIEMSNKLTSFDKRNKVLEQKK